MKNLIAVIFLAAAGTANAVDGTRSTAYQEQLKTGVCPSISEYAENSMKSRIAGVTLRQQMALVSDPSKFDGWNVTVRDQFITRYTKVLQTVYRYPVIIGSHPTFRENQQNAINAVSDIAMLRCLDGDL